MGEAVLTCTHILCLSKNKKNIKLSSGNLVVACLEIAAHSAYELFSKNISIRLSIWFFQPRFLKW